MNLETCSFCGKLDVCGQTEPSPITQTRLHICLPCARQYERVPGNLATNIQCRRCSSWFQARGLNAEGYCSTCTLSRKELTLTLRDENGNVMLAHEVKSDSLVFEQEETAADGKHRYRIVIEWES